jgi:hypothetical protein
VIENMDAMLISEPERYKEQISTKLFEMYGDRA